MLPQYQLACNTLVALYNNGISPTVTFDKNTMNFYLNGKLFKDVKRSEDAITLEDVHLLARAKLGLDGSDFWFISGDKVHKTGSAKVTDLSSAEGFAFNNLACFRTQEDALQALELAKRLTEDFNAGELSQQSPKVKIRMIKDHPEAKEPRYAYDGTSAAFDLAAVETVTLYPMEDAVVPVGLRLSISQDQPYYMTVHMRSSYGFKHGIQNHIGIIDSGYTGDFGIKVFNKSKFPITINKGDYFAQVLVHKKPQVEFEELSVEQWKEYEESQLRGSGGYGSSGK